MFGLFKRKLSFNDRATLLMEYKFPSTVQIRFNEKGLDSFKAEQSLKFFFLVLLWNNERNFVPMCEMYNNDADELWHVFLLDTKGYQDFCEDVMGFFVHHTPYETQKPVSDYKKRLKGQITLMFSKLSSYNVFKYFEECVKVDGEFYTTTAAKSSKSRTSSTGSSNSSTSSENPVTPFEDIWFPTNSHKVSSVSSKSSSSGSSCGSSCSSGSSCGSSCGGGGCGS